MAGDRNVIIEGNAAGNLIVTGDSNSVGAQFQTTTAASDVDIAAVLAALRPLLDSVGSVDAPKIARALDDADHELTKPAPSKDEIGAALERAWKYASTGAKFVETAVNIAPLFSDAVAWLGEHGGKLAGMIGSG